MSGGGFQNTYGAPNQASYPPDIQGQIPYPPQHQPGMYPPAHGGSGFQAPDQGATPYPTGMVTNIPIRSKWQFSNEETCIVNLWQLEKRLRSLRIKKQSHLAKRPSDLKQNGTQKKTPFSSNVFNTLSHGVIRFVASGSS